MSIKGVEGANPASVAVTTAPVNASIDVTKTDTNPTPITPALAAHNAAAPDLKAAAKPPAPEPEPERKKACCALM